MTTGFIYIQFTTGKFALVDFEGKIVLERSVFNALVQKADALQTKAVVCSGNSLKLLAMGDIKNVTDEQARFPADAAGEVSQVTLTPDGTSAAIGLVGGHVLVYLVEVPVLTASRGPVSVYSESLETLVIYDMHKKKQRKVVLEVQPQKVGICTTKLAVGFNNRAWFYNVADASLIATKELSSSIDSIQVTDSAFGCLMAGSLLVTFFDPEPGKKKKDPFHFPDFDTKVKVTAFVLTEYLLLIATDDSALRIWNTENRTFIETYKHPCIITSITPNLSETRFAMIDVQHHVFIFNPIKQAVMAVTTEAESFDASLALFDIADRNVFAVIGGKSAALYHFTDLNVDGPQLKQLCFETLGSMRFALGLSNGSLIYLDGQSNEQNHVMTSHSEIESASGAGVKQLLELHRHRRALQVALQLNDKDVMRAVADHAVRSLCIEIASEAYALAGDACQHNIMNPLRNEEEYSFLRGYVSMMNHEFQAAQKQFLESGRPTMALDMRAALLQFDFALKLAENLDPSRIPQLSHDSARQNELIGNYSQALKQYKESIKCKELQHSSRAGIIRCLILAGKAEQGMEQLKKTKDTKLILECARILERLYAFAQAAQLYQRVEEYNFAAQCYLRAGELKGAADLVSKVNDSKVLRSIGLQLERGGQYDAAAAAFEKANDWAACVHVLLRMNLDRAAAVARDHPSPEVCRLVAEHCVQMNNFRYAIEFLIRSGRSDDAFRVAELHNRMDELAELIGDKGTPQQYEAIATYFCTRSQMIVAGGFFTKAGEASKAMNCYMSDGSDAAMDVALELAEKVADRELRDRLLDYLTANMKNKTRDLRYLLRMFIIMQQFDEAAATATRIVDEFRVRGEYKPGRDLLWDVMRQLVKHHVIISADMKQNFMILHSYLLVKVQKEKNKMVSALLLKRLARFVSKFPAHAANLLVMAVVECSRNGMKRSAYEIATKLLQPEYEPKLKPDVKKKIQTTVRRRELDEVAEEVTKCPACGVDLAMSELYCGQCKSNIPFCGFTGMHMIRDDWCECSVCGAPASFAIMQVEKQCYVCGAQQPNPTIIVNPRWQ
jgi:WD repeat-containing protein 19